MVSGENDIRPYQYMFLIVGFMAGSLLILSFFSSLARQDSWLIVIISFLAVIPLLFACVFISRKFPGKNLMQIHDAVYGKALGRTISALYVLFFLSLLSFNIRDMSVFYTGVIMPETPPIVIMAIITAVCAYTVKKGIKAIARAGFIIMIMALIVFVLTLALLIDDADFENLLPLFELPAEKYIQAVVIMSFVPFGEFALFLMVMPYVKDGKKLGKFSFGGLAIAALFFLLVIVRNTVVLEASGNVFSIPSYESVRMISIGDFLNRVELFIALNQTAALFVKISVLYFAAVKGLSDILGLKSYKPVILPLGAIAIIYAMVAHPNQSDHAQWGALYAPFFEIPFVAVIPLLTLLVILIRRLPRKQSAE